VPTIHHDGHSDGNSVPAAHSTFHSAAAPVEMPKVVGSVNLLDWDEEPSHHHQVQAQSQPSFQQIILKDYNPAAMTPQLFQQKWTEMREVINSKLQGLQGNALQIQAIEENLRNHKVCYLKILCDFFPIIICLSSFRYL
jgi:hypothetical protein